METTGIRNIILVFAVAGMLFSGYLTYYTFAYHASACELYFFGMPSCFYGLLMYLALLVLGFMLRKSVKSGASAALLVLAVIGVLFSGSLTFYLLTTPSCSKLQIFGIPPCIMGLAMYTIILLLALFGIKGTGKGSTKQGR